MVEGAAIPSQWRRSVYVPLRAWLTQPLLACRTQRPGCRQVTLAVVVCLNQLWEGIQTGAGKPVALTTWFRRGMSRY